MPEPVSALEQFIRLRRDLVERGACAHTLALLDQAIDRAQAAPPVPLHISPHVALRRLLAHPIAVNDHQVQMDLLGLQGALAEKRVRRRFGRIS